VSCAAANSGKFRQAPTSTKIFLIFLRRQFPATAGLLAGFCRVSFGGMDDSIKIHAIDLPARPGAARDTAVGKLTALELEQAISLPAAAALNDVHPVTFERAFPHLVRRVGPRRKTVKLRDAIDPQPPPATDRVEAPRRGKRRR
jgi:hypothetical protein